MAEYNALGTGAHGAFTNPDNPVSLGHEFYVTQSGCTVVGYRYYRADTNQTGAPAGSLWIVSGQTIISGSPLSFGAAAGVGWQEARLTTPIALTANTRYKITVNFPSGWTNIADYWSSGVGSAGRTSGPLHMVNSADSTGGQGSYDYGVGDNFCGNGSGNSSSYAVDVIVEDNVVIQPPDPTGPGRWFPFLDEQ